MILDEQIQAIMDRTGLDRAQARPIALREEAARAYQTAEAPAPQRITPGDWSPTSPSSTPPSSSPRPAPAPPHSSPTASSADCRCGGAGYYVADAPYGHPDFARLIPCVCTQAARQARAEAHAGNLLAELHRELGRLRHCTLASFDPARPLSRAVDIHGNAWGEAAQRRSLSDALSVAENYARRPSGWLYIHGPVGSGKSHLAAAIASHLAAQGRRTAYATAAGLITFLKAGFGDGSADRRLLALQEASVLVIDDLGTQRRASAGEWAFEQFYELLNARYLHERPTILTSNLPPDHLEERLRDRVAGMAIEVYLVASSYRKIEGA